MSRPYKIALVIGRFQLLHNEQIRHIQRATELADQVLVLVGSSDGPRTPKNPFTFQERATMIFDWADSSEQIRVYAVPDFPTDDEWCSHINHVVSLDSPEVDANEVVLVGCVKDSSSYYLHKFPQYAQDFSAYEGALDATQMRELFFSGASLKFLEGVVPPTTIKFLEAFKQTDAFQYIVDERAAYARYAKMWAGAPYPVVFNTVDAVVVHNRQVLLIKRKKAPGKGLWALPGGFLEANERIEYGIRRELLEETGLDIGHMQSVRTQGFHTFDDPNRCLGARKITHAGLFIIEGGKAPEVMGMDDAQEAKWVAFDYLSSSEMFEDHFFIIQHFRDKVGLK